MPAPHHQFFTGQMLFLPPNHQHRSTEVAEVGSYSVKIILVNIGPK